MPNELGRALCPADEKARILIVEEDRELAAAIAEVFRSEGIWTKQAHSAEEAMDGCVSFRPHLLVLDIDRRKGKGLNLVDLLRRREMLARLPLAVYSAGDLSAAECRSLAMGPSDFLARAGVAPGQLEALVATMLRRQRRREDRIEAEALQRGG